MNIVYLRSRAALHMILSLFLLTLTHLSSAQDPVPATVPNKRISPQPGRLAFEYILDTRDPEFTFAKVVHVLPNSPAEKGGLRAGMQITAIDNKKLWNKPLTEIGSMLSGEAGTSVSLSVKVPPLFTENTIVLTRELYDFDTVSGNTTRGKEALARKDLNAAIYWLKKAKGSSEASILLASIYSGYYIVYSGMDQHPDEPGNRDMINALKATANADLAHIYLDPLVQEGYPQAYTLMARLYDRNCNLFPRFAEYNVISPADMWLYAAAEAGDLYAQEVVTENIIDRVSGYPNDPVLAAYWAKRAKLQGSERYDEFMPQIDKMNKNPDLTIASLYDMRKMMKVAHMYLGDAQQTINQNKMNPYGLDGFVSGLYDTYLTSKNEQAISLSWDTYTTKDSIKARKLYTYVKGLMMAYILSMDHPTAGEFMLKEYIGLKPEDSYVLTFTATEDDGKSYKMGLGVVLMKTNREYFVELFYQNQDE